MKYLQGIVGSMVSTMAVDPEKAILATILTVVGGGANLYCQKQRKCKRIIQLWKRIKGNQGFCGCIKQCSLPSWMG